MLRMLTFMAMIQRKALQAGSSPIHTFWNRSNSTIDKFSPRPVGIKVRGSGRQLALGGPILFRYKAGNDNETNDKIVSEGRHE